MENIFENAKFGDKFVTRDGIMAIYLGFLEGVGFTCAIKLENEYQLCDYYYNGRWNEHNHSGENSLDIVGRWQESIDDDELDRLQDELNPNNYGGDAYESGLYFGFQDGFAIGYRKAKEE